MNGRTDAVRAVIDRLMSLPEVFNVFVPTPEQMRGYFEKEASVEPGSGMPFRNDALSDCMGRTCFLIVQQGRENFDPTPYHAQTWETSDGRTIAFDVPDGLRHEVEGRDDLVWISEDFAMEPVMEGDDAVIVLHSAPVNVVGEAEGIRDAVVMHPSLPVDIDIRSDFGIPDSADYATGILAFNLL